MDDPCRYNWEMKKKRQNHWFYGTQYCRIDDTPTQKKYQIHNQLTDTPQNEIDSTEEGIL